MPFSTYLRDTEPASGSVPSSSQSTQLQNDGQNRQNQQQTSYGGYNLSDFAQQQGSNPFDPFSSSYGITFNPLGMSVVVKPPMPMGNYFADYQSFHSEGRPYASPPTQDANPGDSNVEQKQASSSTNSNRPELFQLPSFLFNPYGPAIGGTSTTAGTSGLSEFAQQPAFSPSFFGPMQGGDMGKSSCVIRF